MPVPPSPFTKVCIINCASWPWWRWCGGAALLGRAVLRYYLIPRPVLDIDNARGVLAAAVLRYPILRKTSHIGVIHHNCHTSHTGHTQQLLRWGRSRSCCQPGGSCSLQLGSRVRGPTTPPPSTLHTAANYKLSSSAL